MYHLTHCFADNEPASSKPSKFFLGTSRNSVSSTLEFLNSIFTLADHQQNETSSASQPEGERTKRKKKSKKRRIHADSSPPSSPSRKKRKKETESITKLLEGFEDEMTCPMYDTISSTLIYIEP